LLLYNNKKSADELSKKLITMNQKYIFFGGKGGVGKTTCAAAAALQYAKNYKTLIISTDPAHSISDSFGVEIGSEPTFIAENLYGIEINPKKRKEEIKEKLTEEQVQPMMPGMGFGMDFSEIGDMMNLEFPGMDEISALTEFIKYSEGEFEKIIFDTAPTGHTLRLLSLPEMMDTWLGKMLKMRMQFENIIGMFKQFMGAKAEDNSLRMLEETQAKVRKVRDILSSPETVFVLVTIPEQMSILESARYIESLSGYGINIQQIIVNKITPENNCEFCSARRNYQMENLNEIHKLFGNMAIVEIPLFSREIKDLNNLKFFRKFMFSHKF